MPNNRQAIAQPHKGTKETGWGRAVLTDTGFCAMCPTPVLRDKPHDYMHYTPRSDRFAELEQIRLQTG